jgi:Fn3-like domain/Subtilase family
MSTPHIAGSAAVLLDIHQGEDWSPARIKSALVNRADLVVKDAQTGLHDVGPTAQGAGREDLSAAATATTWLRPVSADFGKAPAAPAHSVVITVFNPTGNAQTFTVSKSKFTPSTFGDTVDSSFGAGTISAGDSRVSVVPSFTVPAGGSYDLTVTINPGQSNGVVQGWINLNGAGANDLHFAYFAHVGP